MKIYVVYRQGCHRVDVLALLPIDDPERAYTTALRFMALEPDAWHRVAVAEGEVGKVDLSKGVDERIPEMSRRGDVDCLTRLIEFTREQRDLDTILIEMPLPSGLVSKYVSLKAELERLKETP